MSMLEINYAAARWGATLDGVAAAIGKTRAEVDAFLDGVETEA